MTGRIRFWGAGFRGHPGFLEWVEIDTARESSNLADRSELVG